MSGYAAFDCVMQSSETEGTADFLLGPAVAGYRAFSDVIADSATSFCYEAHAVNASGARTGVFETGIGQFVYGEGSDVYVKRLKCLQSSDGWSLVDFAAGLKHVSIAATAAQVRGLPVSKRYADEPTVIYVRAAATGATGLADTAEHAFPDLQSAVTYALKITDFAEIRLADGSFGDAVLNATRPTRLAIIGGGSATTAIGGIDASGLVDLSISRCAISSSAVGILATGAGCTVNVAACIFDACPSGHMRAQRGAKIVAGDAAVGAPWLNGYMVRGSCSAGAHIVADPLSSVVVKNQTRLLASVSMSGGWVSCVKGLGHVEFESSCSFFLDGFTATGQRYDVRGNSVVNTYAASWSLPGDSAGSVASGGQYL